MQERRGKEEVGWQVNGEHIQRSRLRIDARKWMASKLAPKKYGEKLELDVRHSVADLSDAELADIGLTRGDLRVATDVPFGGDPTVKLRSLATDRAAGGLVRKVG